MHYSLQTSCLAEAEISKALAGPFNTQLVVALEDWKLYVNNRNWANRHMLLIASKTICSF